MRKGDPTISVIISINGNPITGRMATNVGNVGKDCKYMCDDGVFIIHNPDDGAVKLAIKLLERIKGV